MARFTILITGANRGIGLGLLKLYLARGSTTVIAALRKPDAATSATLAALPKGPDSALVIIKLDSSVDSDAAAAMAALKTQHGIAALDLVVANAGISHVFPLVADTLSKDMLDMYHINTVAPVLLLQAARPLLAASPRGTFVGLSSMAAAQVDMPVMGGFPPNGAYGPSKTALNYLLQKAHFEMAELVIFPIEPGFVDTDMGNRAAVAFGMPGGVPPQKVEDVLGGLVKVMDNATRETVGGKFLSYNGSIHSW